MRAVPTATTGRQWKAIGDLIRQGWSPQQIAERCQLEGSLDISHERIYQFVYENKRIRGLVDLCLPAEMSAEVKIELSRPIADSLSAIRSRRGWGGAATSVHPLDADRVTLPRCGVR